MTDKQDLTSVPPSKIIFLLGDDLLSIETKIAEICMRFGNKNFFDLNKVRLDGSSIGNKEISLQLNVFPMGEGKRIVILDNAIDTIGKKGAQKWLKGILTNSPPTTLLVLVLEDKKRYIKNMMIWTKISPKHWLRKLPDEFSNDIMWIELPLPTEREMPAWIIKEAKDQGGVFHPRAATELSRLIGNDLFQARQEVEKAILYVGGENEVGIDDVRLLCPTAKAEKIFDLVDAVGMRNGKRAIGILNKLNKDVSIQYIFSMLVRQIRLLILAKEAISWGGGEKEVFSACGIRHTFLAKKLINQSRHFSLDALDDIYRELDRIDEGGKIGRLSMEAALDKLVAEITT